VIVSTGYEHSIWNRNPVPEQQYSRCRGIYIENVPAKLKESYLTPILTFLFRKTEKKPNTNVIESNFFVSCPIKRTKSQVLTHDNSKHFGWSQNCLDVLYQCLECDAAIYSGSSILGTREFKDTFMEMRQAQATSSQVTIGVTGGCKCVASASASFAGPVESTLESSQRMMEMPSHFMSSTGFCAECLDLEGPKPIARVDFKFWLELPTNEFPDEREQKKYHGMFCTVYPNFKGIWMLLDQNEACEYEFQVERHVCELISVAQPQSQWSLINPRTWFTGKQKPLCDCNKMLETYKVKLYITHRMSNIDTLPQSGIDMVCRCNPKNALVELCCCGPNEASSSTQ